MYNEDLEIVHQTGTLTGQNPVFGFWQSSSSSVPILYINVYSSRYFYQLDEELKIRRSYEHLNESSIVSEKMFVLRTGYFFLQGGSYLRLYDRRTGQQLEFFRESILSWGGLDDPFADYDVFYALQTFGSSKKINSYRFDSCLWNCALCTNQNVCIVCKSGYKLSDDDRTCEEIILWTFERHFSEYIVGYSFAIGGVVLILILVAVWRIHNYIKLRKVVRMIISDPVQLQYTLETIQQAIDKGEINDNPMTVQDQHDGVKKKDPFDLLPLDKKNNKVLPTLSPLSRTLPNDISTIKTQNQNQIPNYKETSTICQKCNTNQKETYNFPCFHRSFCEICGKYKVQMLVEKCPCGIQIQKVLVEIPEY